VDEDVFVDVAVDGAADADPGACDGAAVLTALRNFFATGGSTVDEALFTNSPISLRMESASLLSIPSSLAIWCTRTLATVLLLAREVPSRYLGCMLISAISSLERHHVSFP
jgi:hypothetical protein